MRQPTDPLREPTDAAVRASPMAPPLPRVLLVCLAAGVFLGLVGPLQTMTSPLGLRLGYWVVAVCGGGVIGWAVTLAVLRWRLFEGRPWPIILAISVIMTPPTTVLIWVWGRLAFGSDVFGGFLHLIGPVALICLVMTTVSRLILVRHSPTAPAPPPVVQAPFLDRLPPRLRGAALYAVEAEDHYLRVHTAAGSELILMRLGDALAELAALNGAQTHRSWWVARGAVQAAKRGDGRATLTLKNGLQVPVSRAHAPALRQAGWL